jgi:hypothetical protein
MRTRLVLNVAIPKDRIGFAQLAAIMRPARLSRPEAFDARRLRAVGVPQPPLDGKCAIGSGLIRTHLDDLVPE